MKCNGCKFAEWERTASGRLHPQKQGRCTYLKQHPIKISLPAAFYFGTIWNRDVTLQIGGGWIERDYDYTHDCPTKTT